MAKHRFSKYFSGILLIADLIALNGSFVLSNFYAGGLIWNQSYFLTLITLNTFWTLLFFSSGINELSRNKSLGYSLSKTGFSLAIYLGVLIAYWVLTSQLLSSSQTVLYFLVSFVSWTLTTRTVWFYTLLYARSKGFNVRSFVVVGSEKETTGLLSKLDTHPKIGYRYLRSFDASEPSFFNLLSSYILKNKVDIVFCNIRTLGQDEIKRLVDLAENNLIKIKLVSPSLVIENRFLSIEKFGQIPVINVNAIPLDNWANQMMKRGFDIVFSGIVIVFVLSWLYPLIGLFIKMESAGPILFKQSRNGRRNDSFLCWKFRTMVLNSDSDTKQATKDDSRITKVGSFLRRTSIDELPQFFNVFLGQMSVVGPRPHPIKLNEEYKPRIHKFVQRHAVKPGITGLAQAKGYRGETAVFSDMNGRVRLDRFYVKNWSILLDFKIIALTISSIVRGHEKAY